MRNECLRLLESRIKLPKTKVIIIRTPQGTKISNLEEHYQDAEKVHNIRAYARNAARVFSKDM